MLLLLLDYEERVEKGVTKSAQNENFATKGEIKWILISTKMKKKEEKMKKGKKRKER